MEMKKNMKEKEKKEIGDEVPRNIRFKEIPFEYEILGTNRIENCSRIVDIFFFCSRVEEKRNFLSVCLYVCVCVYVIGAFKNDI